LQVQEAMTPYNFYLTFIIYFITNSTSIVINMVSLNNRALSKGWQAFVNLHELVADGGNGYGCGGTDAYDNNFPWL
jgi:hypothetical protein